MAGGRGGILVKVSGHAAGGKRFSHQSACMVLLVEPHPGNEVVLRLRDSRLCLGQKWPHEALGRSKGRVDPLKMRRHGIEFVLVIAKVGHHAFSGDAEKVHHTKV